MAGGRSLAHIDRGSADGHPVATDFGEHNWDLASRRVGERHPVEHPVLWRVVPDRRRGRRRNRFEPATLADLSVSGARLVVPAGKAPPRGVMVVLDLEGETANARVVRAEPAGQDGPAGCGLTFVTPPPSFMAVVAALTGRGAVRPDYRD